MSTRLRSRRAIPVYLAAIVLPSLLLLFFSWRSIIRQRDAIEALTASNRVLEAQRLVKEVEGRLAGLASACLRDAATAAAIDSSRSGDSDTRDRWHRLQRALLARHPVASNLVVLQDGQPVYPAVHAPLAHPLEPGGPTTREDEDLAAVRRLFGEAERLEVAEHRYVDATVAYRRCLAGNIPGSIQALALARIARCQLRAGARQAGLDAWLSLARNHADERDPAGQPYALVAAVEVSHETDARAQVARAYSDLVGGRWALSADEVEYYLAVLEAALGSDATRRRATPFLRQQRLARALAARPLDVGSQEGIQAAIVRGADNEVYPLLLAPDARRAEAVAIVVNVAWLGASLLPSLSPPPGTRISARVPREDSGASHAPLPLLDNAVELLVPASGPSAGSRRTAWIFGGSTALSVVVLAIGVLLLLRDVARETDLNRMRRELVNGVSHDLKTPLTLIRLFAETLSADEAPGDDDRRHFSGIMVREADRLTRLIDRVLSFSRLESGQAGYDIAACSAEEVVRATLETYRAYVAARGFTLRETIEPGIPPVRLDAGAVSEALLNLLENAMKYSGESREIDLGLHAEGSEVVLEVKDYGPGIDREGQARVFEAFWRANGGSGKGGYGLGLFLVKQIMDAHGGRVQLTSAPGQGSAFRLVFPTVVSTPPARSAA